MEENLFSKLSDFSKLSLQSKLEVLVKKKRFEIFARDINTKESLNSKKVEPYSRKELLRHKNRHFCFYVFNK